MADFQLPDNPAEYIRALLAQYGDKNFVQRILTPDKFPVLDLGEGNYATHKMAWGSGDGKHFMYPTVIQAGDGLKQLDNKTAWEHAMRTGEYIPFANPQEADWFSQNYKQIWGGK